jgi:hypothetical protein
MNHRTEALAARMGDYGGYGKFTGCRVPDKSPIINWMGGPFWMLREK